MIKKLTLAKDLQSELDKIKSTVQLARTTDGELPTEYAFIKEGVRNFHCAFASSTVEFAIILYEVKGVKESQIGCARGVIKGLNRLAYLIDTWVSKQNNISELAKDFKELEIFKPFENKNDDPDIEAYWIAVKNKRFTCNIKFWKEKDWDERYETMLCEAKSHQFFKKLYPLTSHYCLRFMKNKALTEGWPFWYSIVPEADKSLGNYRVQVSKEYSECQYFNDIGEALNFFENVLIKTNSVSWS